MLGAAHWITVAVTALVIVLCVVLHYEVLRWLTDRAPASARQDRRRLVFVILSLVVLHIGEIWIFGAAYYLLLQSPDFGQLSDVDPSLFDAVYFSATVYTTLGFGDIVPEGPVRFLTGTEALTGLMLITWSASFTIFEMLRTWRRHDD